MKLRRASKPLIGGAALSILLSTSSSWAHIRMDFPVARNVWAASPITDPIKDGPCGSGANDPRSTDPAKINVFAPGETIEVKWHETIDHPAHYRIAIDMDGQDDFVNPTGPDDIVDPPVLPILLDGITEDSTGVGEYSAMITLPNETCDNCTLQLIQYMEERPPADALYFVCADLTIEGEVVGGDGDGDADPIDGTGGDSGLVAGSGGSSSGGYTGSTAVAAPSGGSTAGGSTASTGSGGMSTMGSGGMVGSGESTGYEMGDGSDEAAGCTVGSVTGSNRSQGGLWMLGAAGAMLWAARRRSGSQN